MVNFFQKNWKMFFDQFSKCYDRYKFQYRQRRPINEEVPIVKRNEVAKTPFENGKDLFLSISWKFKDVDIQDKKMDFFFKVRGVYEIGHSTKFPSLTLTPSFFS